jgi:small-conductance mechanosensitive channel
MEELALENDTLKTVIDKQAKRIQMWELNSQNSFNALAQSFRARGPGRGSSDPNALAQALAAQGINHVPALPSPPISGQTQKQQPTSPGQAPTSTPDADAAKRIADLEAMLASQNAKVNDLMSNNEKLAKQNERNTQVLSRYREQWEKLKAGARKKEQERRERKGEDGKVGESTKDSEITEAQGEGEEDLEEEPGFGKA